MISLVTITRHGKNKITITLTVDKELDKSQLQNVFVVISKYNVLYKVSSRYVKETSEIQPGRKNRYICTFLMIKQQLLYYNIIIFTLYIN
jgi:hypothetical protein